MKTISPVLSIELHVECPNAECEKYFDLFSETELNDECWLMDQVAPDGKIWTDVHREFKSKVNCPECGQSIELEGIDW